MTAHELARILLEGPDVMVTVRAYEGGVDEIVNIDFPKPIKLNENLKTTWYYGNHEYAYPNEEGDFPLAIHLGD